MFDSYFLSTSLSAIASCFLSVFCCLEGPGSWTESLPDRVVSIVDNTGGELGVLPGVRSP